MNGLARTFWLAAAAICQAVAGRAISRSQRWAARADRYRRRAAR